MSSVSWRDFRASLARNLNRRCSRLERARRSFRLIRSPLFRLRRTAHCADVRLAHPRPYRPARFEIPATDKQKSGLPIKGIRIFVVEVAGFEPAAFWSRIRGFGFPTEQCEFSPFSPGCAMKSPEFPKISGFFMPFLKWTFCLSG